MSFMRSACFNRGRILGAWRCPMRSGRIARWVLRPSFACETLEASTRQFADAMNRREFGAVAARAHPKVAAAVGGQGALAKAMQSSLKDIPFSGMRFQPGRKDCAAVSGDILCAMPYEAVIGIEGEPRFPESFYLASTPDMGGHCSSPMATARANRAR